MTEVLRTDQLKSEARTFEFLLKRYLDDRRFLTGNPDHHLLYFVDAHDLASFIDPERLGRPDDGFTLHAERLRPHASPTEFLLEIKLKNDHLIQDLVLDRDPMQVGLLPSHEEELQDHIDHQFQQDVNKELNLFRSAQRQVRLLMDDPARRETIRRFAAKANAGPMTDPERNGILKFFRTAAPAVLALLWRRPDDSRGRINRLLDDSALCYIADIDWSTYGYTAEVVQRLRTFQPDPTTAENWRRYLLSRRPKSSYRANRIDAQALAWVQGLNQILDPIAHPSTRVILLTRAWSLSAFCVDQPELAEFRLEPLPNLRHPRLSILKSSPEALRASAKAAEDAEQFLAVALASYREQLESLPEGQLSDLEIVEKAVEPLVRALHEFEQTRFALDLRSGATIEDGDIDDSLRQILQLFQSDLKVIDALRQQLLAAVNRFSEDTVNMLLRRRRPLIETRFFPAMGPSAPVPPGARGALPPTQPMDARQAQLSQGPRVESSAPPLSWLVPLTGPLILPLRLPTPEASGADAILNPKGYLEHIAVSAHGPQGWSYLGWAIMLAAEGNPRAARVFCSGAQEIATSLEGRASVLAYEARFLLRQIARLTSRDDGAGLPAGSDGPIHPEATPRPPPADAGEDGRWLLERAVMLLEYLLSRPDSESEQEGAQFVQDIDQAARLCRDPVLRIYAMSVGLIGILSLRSGQRHVMERAYAWHQELLGLMAQLADQDGGKRDRLPLIGRAMELVGYQLVGERSGSAAGPPTEAPGLRIPAGLRLEIGLIDEHIRDYQNANSSRQLDAVTLKAFDALERISDRLQHHLQRDLIFAPIWTQEVVARIIAGIADAAARSAVDQAYLQLTRLAGASQRFGVFPRDRDELKQIEILLLQALPEVRRCHEAGLPGAASAYYHIRMEVCYVRLLLVRLDSKEERDAAYAQLARDYLSVLEEFPTAAIPHFRLNIIYSLLSPDHRDVELEARHLKQAMEAVDSEPFGVATDHWVRSTMLRRQLFSRIREAEAVWKAAPQDEAARSSYLDILEAAVLELGTGLRADASSSTSLSELERRRRINNVVYSISQIIELRRLLAGPSELDAKLKDLDRYRRALMPDGLEKVPEPNIVHTLGIAASALGDMEGRRMAGRRLKELVLTAESGDDEEDAKFMRAADEWLADGGWSLISRPHAFPQGFSERHAPFEAVPAL